MKRWPFNLLGLASSLSLFVGIVAAFVALAGSTGRADDRADEQVVRWDIISVTFPPLIIYPNGTASAKATNAFTPDVETSTITMTGSGTFEVPKKNKERVDVTGGGTWMITPTTGGVSSVGTYKVTGVVFWLEVPGTLSFIDNVGNIADAREGLAMLRIEYSDGDRGILVVSCSGNPTMFEGITASKGLTDFWKSQKNNFTFFHVMQKED